MNTGDVFARRPRQNLVFACQFAAVYALVGRMLMQDH